MLFDFGLDTALKFQESVVFFDSMRRNEDSTLSLILEGLVVCKITNLELASLIWTDRHVLLDLALKQSACG